MELQTLSDQQLRAIAEQYALPQTEQMDRETLLKALKQVLEQESSGFISQEGADDSSGFVQNNPSTEGSDFITSDDQGGSGFIQNNAGNEGSGFITSNDQGGSGFIQNNPSNEGSGFITSNDQGGSGFIQNNSGSEGSGFITSNDQGGSGFIQNNSGNEGSGFITSNNQGGSGFIQNNSGNEGSGFITSNKEGGTESISTEDGDLLSSTQPNSEKSRVHNLGPGDLIELDGLTYQIIEIVSQSSGEAVIYKIQAGNSQPMALKLYFEHQHQQREPNAEALSRIRDISDQDVLRLHGFGTGNRKYQGKYCFEISDFALGGNLLEVESFQQKYTASFLESNVIPEIFNGIRRLHEKRIYHCDIKPQNVFYLDEAKTDLVIGDYGSAKTFDEESEQEARQFSTVIGTNTYLAPEQARGIISEKNDYYSFGMVLLHLMYPQYLTRDDNPRRVDNKKFRKIIENQFARKAVVPFNPKHQRINQLISGMTLYDPHDRWGAEEVKRWLKKQTVKVQYTGTQHIKPIPLGYANITHPQDLLRTIEQHPRRWFGDLIGDRHGYDALLGWLASYLNISAKRGFDEMIKRYKPEGAPYVKEAIFRFFEPDRPVYIGDEAFAFSDSSNLKQDLRRFFASLDAVWKHNDLAKVRYTLFQFEFALRQAKQTASIEDQQLVQRVLTSMASKADVGYVDDFSSYLVQMYQGISSKDKQKGKSYKTLLHWMYLMQSDRVFRDLDHKPVNTLKELGYLLAKDRKAFDHPILRLERAFFLSKLGHKKLINARYDQLLFTIFKEETQTHLNLDRLTVGPDRTYDLAFRYHRSLQEFFKKAKIEDPLRESVEQSGTYHQKKGFFQLPGTVMNGFLQELEEKHQVPQAVLSADNLKTFKRRFTFKAVLQHLRWGIGEWGGAILLVFPLLLVAGFFLAGLGSGQSLFAQYIDATGLDNYFRNGEKYYSMLGGFFLVPAFFFSWYLLSLLGKIWAGRNLQLFGKVGLNTSHFLSIRGWNALGYLVFLLVIPFIFIASNWLYEILGVALMLLVATVFLGMHSGSKAEKERVQQKGGRSKWKIAMIGLMITAVGRFAFEVYSWTDGGVDWENALPNRGWIEFSYYLVIGVLFFGLPIVAQLFSAHNLPRFTLKSLVLAGLGIWFALAPMRIGGQQKTNWLQEPPRLNQLSGIFAGIMANFGEEEVGDTSPEIPGVFLAQIAEGYDAINVREGQSTNTNILGQVKKEQLFLVQSDPRNGWWWITTYSELAGYMHNSKIDKIRTARETDLADFPAFSPPGGLESTPEQEYEMDPFFQSVPEPAAVPPPATPTLKEKDVERLLNRMANPNHPRSTKEQAEDQLLPLFASPESPVFFQTSQGRRKSGYKEVQSYLLELKLTGRYRIKIEEMQVQNGKITELVVYQRRR